MVEMSIRYEKGLRCVATHGPSGAEIFTDAPVDNHGQGRSFSPTDLVCTALGACMMTIMGIVSEREGVDMSGTTIRVSKEMSTTPPRRIARVGVRFELPAKVDPVIREKLERAARTCPVHYSLHPDVKADIEFAWVK